jgi:hypothetical protein
MQRPRRPTTPARALFGASDDAHGSFRSCPRRRQPERRGLRQRGGLGEFEINVPSPPRLVSDCAGNRALRVRDAGHVPRPVVPKARHGVLAFILAGRRWRSRWRRTYYPALSRARLFRPFPRRRLQPVRPLDRHRRGLSRDSRFDRLPQARRSRRRRILRADSVCHGRHGRDGRGARVADRISSAWK